MNIAYLIDSGRWDPATLYTHDIACAMKRLGHDVTVCIPKNDALEQFFNSAELNTRRTIHTNLPFFNPYILSGMIKKEGISIVHANSIRTASIAARAVELSGKNDVKTILTPHCHENDSQIARNIITSLDALATHTIEAPHYLKEIPIRVFALRYSIPDTGQPAQEPSSSNTITVNGAITQEKHIDKLFEAVSNLDGIDYRIRIIGEGKAAHVMPLKQAAQRFDIADRIEWLGNRPDALDLIKDSAVGVELSGESGLYRVAEFQSAGVPVIASGSFGADRYINDGENGFIVPSDDLAEKLTEALHTALSDRTFLNRFKAYRENNPIEPYDNYAMRLTSIYSSLL